MTTAPAPRFAALRPGDPAPCFTQRGYSTPRFVFDTVAGRWIVMCFHGSTADPAAQAALAAVRTRPDLFDDRHASFFSVSTDPGDLERGLRDALPGFRCLLDHDGAVSRLYGALPEGSGAPGTAAASRRLWYVLDPMLRVAACFDFGQSGGHQAVLALLEALPAPGLNAGFEVQAPILVLPRVFEPALCEALVAAYRQDGGTESGFMREIDGVTVPVHDAAHKRRRDAHVVDPELVAAVQSRIRRRVLPEIRKAHQFEVTRMERYIVACYDARDGGHFRAHRDNTTSGTAHRRFAVSINLNADFDGGELAFPEFGTRTFKPSPGTALVFSCSLLHAVTPVTRGRRFAFLPFLYDESAAQIRRRNLGRIASEAHA